MSHKQNRLYEGMYILSAALNEEGRREALDKISALITSRGGEVCKTFDQGRKRLAYEIKGKREGYYYLLYFTVSPSALVHMRREHALHEDLLRCLILGAESVPNKIEFKQITE